MKIDEMSASQIADQLAFMFDWERRPHEGKFLQRAIDLLKGQSEIVRCKDCRYRSYDNCPFNEFSELYKPGDDFYCADGAKKDD